MSCKKTQLFVNLPYKRVFSAKCLSSNCPATPMTTWLQTVWDWRLPKRYYLSMCLKGLQSCRLSNFFHFSKTTFLFLCIILSYENSATYEHFWKISRKFYWKQQDTCRWWLFTADILKQHFVKQKCHKNFQLLLI